VPGFTAGLASDCSTGLVVGAARPIATGAEASTSASVAVERRAAGGRARGGAQRGDDLVAHLALGAEPGDLGLDVRVVADAIALGRQVGELGADDRSA
jgi:hypothetical protein